MLIDTICDLHDCVRIFNFPYGQKADHRLSFIAFNQICKVHHILSFLLERARKSKGHLRAH